MRISKTILTALVGALALILGGCGGAGDTGPVAVAETTDTAMEADQFPRHAAQLSGTVTGSQTGVLPVVYAYNTDRDVGYMVYVVDGKYRAVNLMPGPYDVTIRPAIDQLEGFTPETVQLDVAADAHVTADFALKNVGPVPNYVGGYPYEDCARDLSVRTENPICGTTPNAKIVPYEELFPPGPGRDILERYCFGCHNESIISYNRVRMFPAGRPPHDKAGWAATVDRMNARWPARDPKTDPLLLPPKDRDIVVDYLAEHFGADSEPRVLQLSSEAELDLKVLEKAQIVEYIYHEDPEKYSEHFPWSHNVAFGPDGNVWIAYRACCIVRFDPRTGEQKVFEGNGGGSGIIVDHLDGTVWYSGQGAQKNNGGFAPGVQQFASVRHLDPETGLVDTWLGQYTIGLVFDSQANLWMSGIKKWERNTNTMKRWGVPVIRTGGYGTVIDSQDRLWFGEHYLGGVTLFDPKTEIFTNFQLTEKLPSNTRRPGIDSKDMIWMGDWAHPNRRQANGRDKGGSLHRLNPETGEVTHREMGIEYSAPYDTDVDPDDNVWVTNDNYLTKYDQKADTFTHYPVVRRSDTLKTSITRDGAIWFVMRNASKYSGTGGMAAVLYTDKDKIKTLGAYYAEGSDHYRYYDYSGPMPPKVTGTVKASGQIRYNEPLQNAEEYEKWVTENASLDSGYN